MLYADLRSSLISQLKSSGIKNKKVLQAISQVPREKFIDNEYRKYSYENSPQPIGFNQTISQPYTVAFMLEKLKLRKTDKVLEIGTGSGYNAAVMSLLCKKVITIELIKELAERSENNLKDYKNVKVVHADGSLGFSKHAPYHRIISTAAVREIPEEWVSQLKDSGVIISPIGLLTSSIFKITKKGEKLTKQEWGNFSFVPLRGKKGFN